MDMKEYVEIKKENKNNEYIDEQMKCLEKAAYGYRLHFIKENKDEIIRNSKTQESFIEMQSKLIEELELIIKEKDDIITDLERISEIK